MQLRIHAALALLLVPLSSACLVDRTTTNVPISREVVGTLTPGTTTAREAVAALGAPLEVVQLGLRSAYRYEFVVSKRAGLVLILVGLISRDTRSDRAWLFFDEEDVLTHVAATFEGADSQYAMPWDKVHE